VVGGTNPPDAGSNKSLPCFECSQPSHMRNYCPQLHSKVRAAGIQYGELLLDSMLPDEGNNQLYDPLMDVDNPLEGQENELDGNPDEPNAIWHSDNEVAYQYDDGVREQHHSSNYFSTLSYFFYLVHLCFYHIFAHIFIIVTSPHFILYYFLFLIFLFLSLS
jgi:hypothetical protein